MTSATPPASGPSTPPSPPAAAAGHRSLLATGVVLSLLVAAGAWWLLDGADRVTTEDAYVDGNVVQVTPQTSGTVTAIGADNTDMIRAGQVLVTLNPIDAALALQKAEAQLAKTVRQVRGQFSSATQMRANIKQRQVEVTRARADLQRRAALVKTGAVSQEEYNHMQDTLQAAEAALAVAEQQFATNQALVDATSVTSHPDVMMAATQVRDAYIGTVRGQLRAPTAGMVTRRTVQVGQHVSPGMALMAVVPLDHLWVSANFQESQLEHLRIGQAVTVTADLYGGAVRYTGHVQGLDAGTGSAFSLMPAQNATGNWIKVVQRVPVRIALDPAPLLAHPLRLGLSMKVDIDTSDRRGGTLATPPDALAQGYATKVFDREQAGADALVTRIIGANAGGAPAPQRLARR